MLWEGTPSAFIQQCEHANRLHTAVWEDCHCCGRAAIAAVIPGVTERTGSHPRGLPALRQRPEGRMLGYVDGIRESPILCKGISLTL